MTPFDVGLTVAIVASLGGLAIQHQFRRARQARIRTEAESFGGRLDNSE